MARITVEDCLKTVPNRFALVIAASRRARQLLKGSASLVENRDKNREVVVALREVAANKVLVLKEGAEPPSSST